MYTCTHEDFKKCFLALKKGLEMSSKVQQQQQKLRDKSAQFLDFGTKSVQICVLNRKLSQILFRTQNSPNLKICPHFKKYIYHKTVEVPPSFHMSRGCKVTPNVRLCPNCFQGIHTGCNNSINRNNSSSKKQNWIEKNINAPSDNASTFSLRGKHNKKLPLDISAPDPPQKIS